MLQVTAPGVKALSPLPSLMAGRYLFLMLLLYQHLCQEVEVKTQLLLCPSPQTGSYSLCQICHLLHSFHSPREWVQLDEEVLGFPDADGFLL